MNNPLKVGIGIPVANEEQTIDELVLLLNEVVQCRDESIKVYFIVDEFSRDATSKKIKEHSQKYNWCEYFFFKESNGVVSCYLKGLSLGLKDNCEILMEMDGGLSHDPKSIPIFLDQFKNPEVEIVFASRYLTGGRNLAKKKRNLLSFTSNVLCRLYLQTQFTDIQSGFKAYRANVARLLVSQIFPQGSAWQIKCKYLLKKLNWVEVPIIYSPSTSTIKFSWIFGALVTLIKTRFEKPFSRDSLK